MIYPRIKNIQAEFQRESIDAFLVTKNVNIRYLTGGFPADESWMVIGPQKAFYITDFRYLLEAREGLPGIRVKCFDRSIYEDVFKIVSSMKCQRLGMDERHVTLAQYRALQKACPKGIRLIGVNDVVERFRVIKGPEEVMGIRSALKIHKQAHAYLKRIIKPGISEKDVLLRLGAFVRSKDADFSFDPIVASGPNSCYPHAKVTSRRIQKDEPVLIDMGIDVKGYKSDLTRMFFLGRIPPLAHEVEAYVREAQQRAMAIIRDGVPISEVDGAARNFLLKKKLAKYFGHALGHGVGLEIHENPRLSRANREVLREGMVITIEPAVYLPGQFGIRLEEMVLVRKSEGECLSDDIH